jgi:hypothetical protein
MRNGGVENGQWHIITLKYLHGKQSVVFHNVYEKRLLLLSEVPLEREFLLNPPRGTLAVSGCITRKIHPQKYPDRQNARSRLSRGVVANVVFQ